MSLKTIFTEVCEKLENTEDVSNKFSNLKNDEDRFLFTYELCEKFISNYNFNFETITKNKEKSEKVRKAGNESFVKNLHWEALKFYNESIALAPNESEELAFAFGNRAACLLKLNFHKEALWDIERALKLPVTNDFKKKLLIRKEKCSCNENDNSTNVCMLGSGDLVPLSSEKSSFFESASASVGLLIDEYFERQLIALDDIKTGEILIVEKPYSSVLLPSLAYTHCVNCFRRSITLLPCKGCSRAMFCREKCKINSSKRYHEIECPILDILYKLNAQRMELLSLRILIDSSQQGKYLEKLYIETMENSLANNNRNENCQIYKSLDYVNIYNLVTNSEKRTVPDLFYRSIISLILIILLEKHTNFFNSSSVDSKGSLKIFSGSLILHFLQSLPCNAHEISEFCEDGLNEIGAAAYATLSLINHSCDPNVVRHSCEDVVVLRAIRPIKKGEQILDNYGYHYATHSLNERQNALIKQYYFKCQCEPCMQLWPTYKDLPENQLLPKKNIDMNIYKKLTDKFEKNLDKIFNGKFDFDTIEENLKYLDFLDENVKRPWKIYNKCQEAIKHCLSFSGNHFRFSKGVSS